MRERVQKEKAADGVRRFRTFIKCQIIVSVLMAL